jgi:N-acetyl sugar amidotransferase
MPTPLVISETDPRYRRCTASVMDNIADPDIRFDAEGVCQYLQEYRQKEAASLLRGEAAEAALERTVDRIRTEGRGKKYDCVMGLSGGVDSTYVALLARRHGLRPLAVHFDNGWNSELSVMNIENIISRLGIDLHTYVVDWEEFRDLQLAYLRASVVDIEAITDHAIACVLIRLAGQMGIPYILSGSNVQTESTMPRSWVFPKADPVNIRAIHKAYGQRPLKTFPLFDARVRYYYTEYKGIHSVSLLNLVDYDKKVVKETIQRELAWRDYGGKHYESIWTRFYQGYILPAKFHIDKRKPHLSDLVFAGQITRDEALAELAQPIYDPAQYQEDRNFVLKKLRLTEQAFDEIMSLPPRSHYAFDYDRPLEERMPLLVPFKRVYRWFFPFRNRHEEGASA